MKFIRKSIQWLQREWSDKTFRIYAIVNLFLLAALVTENISLFSMAVSRMVRYSILFAGLAVIAWIDRRSKRIPNEILLALLLLRVIVLAGEWLVHPSYGLALLISALAGGLIGGGLFIICYFLSRGGVGMGDIKLFAVMGVYLGLGVIMTTVFLTVLVSAVYSVVQLIRKKTKLKDEVPFAPFAWIGLILTMAIGM